MNKIFLGLLSVTILFGESNYNGSTTAPVVLAGGIIKAQHTIVENKYKRKDCPICKGQGWYISGDGIKKVDCGYCEPDKKGELSKVITHPPVIIKQNCPNGVCPIPNKR